MKRTKKIIKISLLGLLISVVLFFAYEFAFLHYNGYNIIKASSKNLYFLNDSLRYNAKLNTYTANRFGDTIIVFQTSNIYYLYWKSHYFKENQISEKFNKHFTKGNDFEEFYYGAEDFPFTYYTRNFLNSTRTTLCFNDTLNLKKYIFNNGILFNGSFKEMVFSADEKVYDIALFNDKVKYNYNLFLSQNKSFLILQFCIDSNLVKGDFFKIFKNSSNRDYHPKFKNIKLFKCEEPLEPIRKI